MNVNFTQSAELSIAVQVVRECTIDALLVDIVHKGIISTKQSKAFLLNKVVCLPYDENDPSCSPRCAEVTALQNRRTCL